MERFYQNIFVLVCFLNIKVYKMPCNCEDDNGVPMHQNGCRLTAGRSTLQQNGYRHRIHENGSSTSEEVDPDLVRLIHYFKSPKKTNKIALKTDVFF